ncbi:FAGL091Wp [Eremothecium gossypii FDAG1]|nr:FAGL091Wp [Eremothecium gossypii FDAG1]
MLSVREQVAEKLHLTSRTRNCILGKNSDMALEMQENAGRNMHSQYSPRDSDRPRKRIEKVIELIEVDGKKVSKTATGKRKFHNKSKNGCDNCKRRRVKCDEGKPGCQKCLKMRLSCVYTPAKPRKKKDRDVETVIKYVTRGNDEKDDGDVDTVIKYVTRGNDEKDDSRDELGQQDNQNAPLAANLAVSGSQIEGAVPQTSPSVTPDASLLPPLFVGQNSQQLQQQLMQQPHLLPQLMTLSNSERFATFELPNSPIPLQATAMNTTNSINSVFTNTRFASNLLQQISQSPDQADLSSSVSKNGINLKQFGGPFPSAGIGGVTYDFQELIGIKAMTTKEPEVTSQQQQISNVVTGNTSMLSKQPLVQCSSLEQQHSRASGRSTQHQPRQAQQRHSGSQPDHQHRHQQLQQSHMPQLQDVQIQQTAAQQSPSIPVQDSLSQRGQSSATAVLSSLGSNGGSANMMDNPTISPIVLPMSPMSKASESVLVNNTSSTGVGDVSNSASRAAAGAKTQQNTSTRRDSISASDNQLSEDTDGQMCTSDGCGILSFSKIIEFTQNSTLNLVDLRLFHHYCTKVWPTIISAGISEQHIWSEHIPELAFRYPFLMHALLAFSATHLSRTEVGLEPFVACHRLESLKLLREAVLQICEENTDALVASALILIMDSLANAASPNPAISSAAISPSAWIFHVKGAATILTAVWPLTPTSRFYNLINVDLSDLGDIINSDNGTVSELVCFDNSISDLYPVEIDSPYLITLAYLDKLHKEKDRSGFILRVFAFPALLDKTFLALLMTGDLGAMRIMRSYYKLLRGYATEMKDRVWFLEGMTQVLPQDVDEYSGGGGMHMMLDFLGGGLPSMTTTNFTEFVYNE